MPFHPTLRERLTRDFPICQDEVDKRSLAMYRIFLRFFEERIAVEHFQPEDVKIGVVLVYGWNHPIQLSPDCWTHLGSATELLKQESGARLSATEIDRFRRFVGGSLIATSKFLHFLNPIRYAMWDDNVARAAYRYSWRQCNQSACYIEYLRDLEDFELVAALRQRVHNVIGGASELRSKEFALSQLGKWESRQIPNALGSDMSDYPFATEKFKLELGEEGDPS